MKTTANILIVLLLGCAITSCNKTELQNINPAQASGQHRSDMQLPLATDRNSKPATAIQTVKVYFDWNLYSIQLNKIIEEPPFVTGPEKREPADLYVYNSNTLSGNSTKPFYAISNAMDQTNAMLMHEMRIDFKEGIIPRQFYSREEVLGAAQGIHPIITLTSTGTLYIGSVYNLFHGPPVQQPVKSF